MGEDVDLGNEDSHVKGAGDLVEAAVGKGVEILMFLLTNYQSVGGATCIGQQLFHMG